MMKKTVILLILLLVLITLSVSSVFYKTIVEQNLVVQGIYIEFISETESSVWVRFEESEFELLLQTTDKSEILEVVAEEMDTSIAKLDDDFIEIFNIAFDGE